MACRATLAAIFALLTVCSLAACDTGEEPRRVSVQGFEQGVATDSESGAFRVVLTADGGLHVGENTVTIRLGFHDPTDPLDPGRGIPGAEVELDAWMHDGYSAVSGLRGVYVDDGEYVIGGLLLTEPGIWQLDFALTVGESIDDSVSFAFVVSD